MLDRLREDPQVIEVSEPVHGECQWNFYRSTVGNDGAAIKKVEEAEITALEDSGLVMVDTGEASFS